MAGDAFSVDWMQGWNELQRKIWNEWVAVVSEKLPGTPPSGMEHAAQWPLQWLQQAMAADPGIWSAARGGMGGTSPWSMPWSQPTGFGSGLFPSFGSGSFPSFGSGSFPGMDDWRRTFGVYEPSPESFVVKNMAAVTESFMHLSREIFQAMQRMGEGVQNGEEWTTLLDRSFQRAKEVFNNSSQRVNQSAADPLAAWGQPLQMWMGMLKNNPQFSNSLTQLFTGGGGGGGFAGQQQMASWFEQLLNMPGLGPAREKQERLQAAIRDGMAYQKAWQAFEEISRQVNLSALDLLHKKLLERGANDKPVGSLHDLYVLWVDCSEETNSEFVRGQQYQEANARMVNALMRVQQHAHGMVDDILTALHVPTRREVDSSHRQMQELKRRVWALEEEVRSLRGQNHSQEISAIRDDLERLDVRHLRQELADMKKLLEIPLGAQAQPDNQPDKKAAAVKPRVVVRDKGKSQAVDVDVDADAGALKGE